jgi:hypothetical protein
MASGGRFMAENDNSWSKILFAVKMFLDSRLCGNNKRLMKKLPDPSII